MRGHDKACAARFVQVAVEVADPDVIAVTDFVVLIDAGQAERQAWISFDFVGVDFIDIEGWIGHYVVGFAEQFVRVLIVGNGLADVAFKAMHCEVHSGEADGGGVFFYAAEGELFGGMLPLFFDGARTLHEHATRPTGRVEYCAAVGFEHMGDQGDK